MRSHRESISLIKGETGTGAPVARADTRARIQRRRKFMPVPYRRRRQAYDVPSTVSPRRTYTYTRRSPSVSLSLCPPCLLVSPLDRSNADHSSLSADGEPLSKSYATRDRSSVDYFSKSSGSRIFKWRLNETGSPPRSVPCERLSASVDLDRRCSNSLRSSLFA